MNSKENIKIRMQSNLLVRIKDIASQRDISANRVIVDALAFALNDPQFVERYFFIKAPSAQQLTQTTNSKPPAKAEVRAQILNRILKVVNLVNSYDDNKEGRYTLQILGNNETVCDFQNKQNLTIGQGALDYLEKTYWIFLQEDIDPNDKTMLISEGKYTKEEYEAHYNYWQRAQTDQLSD